jgi:outer membrane protein assembly factor BamD (BamD/ComL family)
LLVAESESQRVARARARLRSGDARRALEELRSLEQDEPRGLLVQEREALLIEALAAVGQRESARERAKAFLKRYPSSPHVRAVERAVE